MPLDFPNSPTNGQYYGGYVYNSASEVWDSAYAPRAATIPISSPNYMINGAFDFWQRGTSFSNPASATYQADRFITFQDGTGTTRTISQQTFAPGTSPISSIDTAYYLRYTSTVLGTTTYQAIQNRVEDVRTLAGQTATFSFYAKADAAKTITLNIQQNFGSGGSSSVVVNNSASYAVTTSWQRFTTTVTIPSLSGKTIGTSSFLQVGLEFGAQLLTIDLCGWQLESGAAPTEFRRNANSIQGELAACQRYFMKFTSDNSYGIIGHGKTFSTTLLHSMYQFPVQMRVTPTDYGWNMSGAQIEGMGTSSGIGSVSFNTAIANSRCGALNLSGSFTLGYYWVMGNSNSGAYVYFGAEL